MHKILWYLIGLMSVGPVLWIGRALIDKCW